MAMPRQRAPDVLAWTQTRRPAMGLVGPRPPDHDAQRTGGEYDRPTHRRPAAHGHLRPRGGLQPADRALRGADDRGAPGSAARIGRAIRRATRLAPGRPDRVHRDALAAPGRGRVELVARR